MPSASATRSAGAAALALLVAAACAAPRQTVVLLPDPDGKVGVVTVSNAAGSQTLEKARESVDVRDARTAPTKPAVMEEARVQEIFGPALRAMPPPPARFILYFENGSVSLTAESQARIPEIVKAIGERAGADVGVVGHTDTVGDARQNYDLSLKRAQAVAEVLAAAGVPREALEISSHGEENPLVPTGDNVAEPRNRRVEVTVR